MRPLDELPDRALRATRGIVFDIDDTVTRGGVLEREAIDAIYELAAAGLATIAVTGRPLGWTDVIARHWPVSAAVGENGAGWAYREGREVREGYYHEEAERRAQRARLDHIVARVRAELPEIREARDQRARRCDVAFDVGELCHAPRSATDALIALIRAEGARAPASSVHVHAVVGDWDKAKGVVRAAAELGHDVSAAPERWIFVGDSGNDEEAFAYFPLAVGVANVAEHLDQLRARPAFVTARDRGLGFSDLAARVLGAR